MKTLRRQTFADPWPLPARMTAACVWLHSTWDEGNERD